MARVRYSEVILASGSAARRSMLEAAGVSFRVVPAEVDEEEIRRDYAANDPDGTPTGVSRVLARAKAEEVSRRFPAALVIGADQVLELGREIHNKPADMDAARRVLRALSGRTHRLLSTVALAEAGRETWSYLDAASMSMRDFSDAFLDGYLAQTGDRICACVGAYELEGLGVQLFDSIEGDFFTILGMPLLELLAELRVRGAIPA